MSGIEAMVNVFRIEKSPGPAAVIALILYYTSWVTDIPEWVNIRVFKPVEPICYHSNSESVVILKNTS